MKKVFYCSFIFCFGLLGYSCKDDPGSVFQGCCGNPPLTKTFGNAHVYVANLFTPNGDGINDYMYISADSTKKIVLLDIKNRSGVSVYHESDISYSPISTNGWDGRVNGKVEKGFYTFTLTLEAEDGTISTFEGGVCNYPCDFQGEEEKISPTNCTFPSQSNRGTYDPSLPSGEQNGCFAN